MQRDASDCTWGHRFCFSILNRVIPRVVAAQSALSQTCKHVACSANCQIVDCSCPLASHLLLRTSYSTAAPIGSLPDQARHFHFSAGFMLRGATVDFRFYSAFWVLAGFLPRNSCLLRPSLAFSCSLISNVLSERQRAGSGFGVRLRWPTSRSKHSERALCSFRAEKHCLYGQNHSPTACSLEVHVPKSKRAR